MEYFVINNYQKRVLMKKGWEPLLYRVDIYVLYIYSTIKDFSMHFSNIFGSQNICNIIYY